MKIHSNNLARRTNAIRLTFHKSRLPYSFWFNARFISALGFSLLILLANGCKKKPVPSPPPEVQVITLAPTNVPIFEEWIGTLDGFVNAQIRAQVSGYLLTQNYAEGSAVKKGDILFQIDPRPFQAALDQANAKLAQDQAQAGKTALDVKRYKPLAKEQAISEEELDNACRRTWRQMRRSKRTKPLWKTRS
jgi:membrane fusion protein (multidrug efflux system)